MTKKEKINYIAEKLLQSNLCTPKLNKILGLIVGMYPDESCARDANGDVYLINSYGKFLGRVNGKITGNVLLRRTQYRWSDNVDVSVRLARRFIAAKIINSRAVLHRALRDHSEVVNRNELEHAINMLGQMPGKLDKVVDGNGIRGVEGEAAYLYFSNFNHCILHQKTDFDLQNRNRCRN